LQPITSEFINQRVPSKFRDSENNWYGLTKRYRVLAYSKDRVDPNEIKSYEDLANPKWKGKIVVRSSDNTYNQSLMASVIANGDAETAGNWAKSVVANFARTPKGNDRDQVKEVAAGRADIAIINTYYLGKLLNSKNEAEVEAGQAVGLIFPNQEDRGAHVNISGIGVCKNAPNKENAIQLIEYLLSDEVQAMYSAANYEYPIVDNIEACALLKSWGKFKEDAINLEEIGKLNASALTVFARAGWE
ncbi:MAG: extracellular solute-binding protein, partial [Flavobacteriales bacterium]|nr:extracellular solute-binding protein [Flavobacteriales bacterium]